MVYKKINLINLKGKNKIIETCTILFLLSIVLFVFGFRSAEADSGLQSDRKSILYMQLINYTVPLIKIVSFDEEDSAEENLFLKAKLSKFSGMDISNPISIFGREISMINCIGIGNKASNEDKLNPYKLSDKDVMKFSDSSNSQDVNLNNNSVSVYNPKLKKNLDTGKPEVFIYHTHTTESYSPGPQDSFDDTKNVCAVGDALSSELEGKYGISVVHDKTVHNAYAYAQSYERSAVTVDKYLKKYGDFKLVIDMHRDSADDKSDAAINRKDVTIKMNNENVAKFMFVMAKNNPHYSKNIVVANKLISISDKLFPGFCKGALLYNHGIGYFNQDKSNNSVLIEVGSNVSTTDEAKASGKYLARIIAEYLNGK